MSWSSHGARRCALALCVTFVACPSAVGCSARAIERPDREQPAIDIEACARGLATCARIGDVRGVSSLVPGEAHAVRLGPGGSIEAPLLRPSPTARLVAIGLGVRVIGAALDAHAVEIAITGLAPSPIRVATPVGFRRVEVTALDVVPPADASVRIAGVNGGCELTYVVGRWND